MIIGWLIDRSWIPGSWWFPADSRTCNQSTWWSYCWRVFYWNVIYFFDSFHSAFVYLFTKFWIQNCPFFLYLFIHNLLINNLEWKLIYYFREDLEQKINFREFIRVLAHFRPISKEKRNILNSREEKLKCKQFNVTLNLMPFYISDWTLIQVFHCLIYNGPFGLLYLFVL